MGGRGNDSAVQTQMISCVHVCLRVCQYPFVAVNVCVCV